MDIQRQAIIVLQNENEKIRFLSGNKNLAIITATSGGDESEWFWNKYSKPTFFLQNTNSGEKVKLSISYPLALSPSGKYLIGTDSANVIPYKCNSLYVYNLETQKTLCITENLPIPIDDVEVFGSCVFKHRGLDIAGWLKNDESILVYDKFDIWKLDIQGKITPINLTNSFGRQKNITFRLSPIYSDEPLNENREVILKATNNSTKENGIYGITFNNNCHLRQLYMGAYSIEDPIKAKNAQVYIIQKGNASISPNYFYSYDLKKYHKLSEVYPENNYNWISSQLVAFSDLNGSMCNAILYKPENFNSKLKYPVIINYYESRTGELNMYKTPQPTAGAINIPWFVSQGYIVFVPDINVKEREPGKSAFNVIIGAANYLKKYSWIDSSKMGIQGHSFGGYVTNYIVTHSNIFAAAASASGFCDLISLYGSTMQDGGTTYFHNWSEIDQGRLLYTLWQKPELYIENSPIFGVENVSTPILMMNNKGDGIVPFSQGVEFFTALRRLQKRVWMLEYSNGTHSLSGEDALDYTFRITEFFNHFLKCDSTQKWMEY